MTPTTDTRPLSERLTEAACALGSHLTGNSIAGSQRFTDFRLILSELARRVEALESRPAQDAEPDGILTKLEALRNQLEITSRLLVNVRRERDELKAQIGTPPVGSHPDEAKPRNATWHKERQSWANEVEAMRTHISKIEAQLATALQKGAEAERKRIAEALRKCDLGGRLACALIAKEGGAS